MKGDGDIETRIRESLGHVPPPEGDLPRLVKRSRALRVRRMVAGAVAVTVIGLGIGLPLAALSRLGNDNEATPSAGPTHAVNISLQVPGGWDSRLVTQYTGDLSLVVANFTLPDEDIPYETRNWASISTKSVVLFVVDQTSQIIPPDVDVGEAAAYRDEDFQPVEGPVAFRDEDFGARFEGTPPDHALALRDVRIKGIPLTIWAEFGTDPAEPILTQAVNDVLATLRVTAGPAPGPTIGTPPDEGETGYQPPSFDPAPGWYTATSGTLDPDLDTQPGIWAANIPFADEDLAASRESGALLFLPRETMRRLGANGVVLVASIVDPGGDGPVPAFPTATLPLEVADAEVRLAWESQVAENVPEYLLVRNVAGWQLDVRIYFGTLEPSAETLALAQEQLARLRLPEPHDELGPYVDEDDGVAITVPSGWTIREDPSGPDEPRTLLAIASYDFARGGDCAPTAAQTALPDEGALMWLIEYTAGNPAEYTETYMRPEMLELYQEDLGNYECSVVPSYMTRFWDDGRFFQAHVAFGTTAPDAVRSEMLEVLNSFTVLEPSSKPCPETGPWSHPTCAGVHWVRALLAEAGFPETGDTGSALVSRAESFEFYIHTTPVDNRIPEAYPLYGAVDGVPLFGGDIHVVWSVDDLSVWVSSAGVRENDVLPGMDVFRALVRASFRVPYSGA